MSKISISVVYAEPTEQRLLELQVPPGTTISQAIEQSGLPQAFPKVDFAKAPKGIFGQPRQNTDLVKNGDRVEVYRPLLLDPKESRRQRAAR